MTKPNTPEDNTAAQQSTPATPASGNELTDWLTQQVQRQQRMNIALVIWIGILTLALAGFVTYFFVEREANKPLEVSVTTNQVAPKDAASNNSAIALNMGATPKANAITLDIHVDYQCPYCASAEKAFGPSITQLAQSGDLNVNYHIRTFLDSMIGNDSSEQAAIAASCADNVGKFPQYNQVVFDNQPKEGVGYTHEQLLNDFGAQAGITGKDFDTFEQCYLTSATKDYVDKMESINIQTVQGTPTFIANGYKLDLSLLGGSDAQTFLQSIQNAMITAAQQAADPSTSDSGVSDQTNG
jgi:protein-disulfide isomerase